MTFNEAHINAITHSNPGGFEGKKIAMISAHGQIISFLLGSPVSQQYLTTVNTFNLHHYRPYLWA